MNHSIRKLCLGIFLTLSLSLSAQDSSSVETKTISVNKFKAHKSIATLMPKDFLDPDCKVAKWELWVFKEGQDPSVVNQEGAKFRGLVLRVIKAAQKGEIYSFKAISVHCPKDAAPQVISEFSYQIN